MEGVATSTSARGEPSGDPLWWLLLVTGSLWVIFALIVFRFDYTTVSALSILLGTVCIAAALLEVFSAFGAGGWWRVTHLGLAIAFAIIGGLAYAHPQNTFKALATIFAFFLFLRGIFDVVRRTARAARRALVGDPGVGRRPDPARLLGGRRLRAQGVPARGVGRRLGARARNRPDRDGLPPPPEAL